MMKYINLNERGFADESGYLHCHICNYETAEYIGPSDEYISKDTGLPAWAFLEGPSRQASTGHVWIRTADEWKEVEDHRGTIVYDTTNKECSEVSVLGPIPDGKTTLVPTSIYDKWSGVEWVKDDAAEQLAILAAAKAEQSARIVMADRQISTIKPAVDGGYAKPEHTQLLADWQRYRYELTLVPEKDGWPESPQWPTEPDKVI